MNTPHQGQVVLAGFCWIWLGMLAEASATPRTGTVAQDQASGQSAPRTPLRVARTKKTPGKKAKKPGKGEQPGEAPAAPEGAPPGAAAPGSEPGATQPLGLSGSNRVEFDAQLIKGQVTKAGEVQVLERKETEIKSLVKRRTSFREEIIKTVFPQKQQ